MLLLSAVHHSTTGSGCAGIHRTSTRRKDDAGHQIRSWKFVTLGISLPARLAGDTSLQYNMLADCVCTSHSNMLPTPCHALVPHTYQVIGRAPILLGASWVLLVLLSSLENAVTLPKPDSWTCMCAAGNGSLSVQGRHTVRALHPSV